MGNGSGAHGSLYAEVTGRIIAQLKKGRLPWVQPWDGGEAATGLPRNAATGRCYSGINVLILWDRIFLAGYDIQRWLTYRQAQTLGGHVGKGEVGTTVCYADRFTPREQQSASKRSSARPTRSRSSSALPSSMSRNAKACRAS